MKCYTNFFSSIHKNTLEKQTNITNRQIKTFANRTYFINLPRSKLTDFIYT